MDTLSPKERSERMARIRGTNSKPELVVRRLVHGMGYRYRLHCRNCRVHLTWYFLEGKRSSCSWMLLASAFGPLLPAPRPPKTKVEFWAPKLAKNRERDTRHQERLREMGWDILVIWQCQLKDIQKIKQAISKMMEWKVPQSDGPPIRTVS